MSRPALNRSRAPMGGALAFEPALCDAGQTWPLVPRVVTRKACVISPAPATSSYRSSPGNTARPAASAEVQPSGRRAFVDRSNTAPDPASHRTTLAFHGSHSSRRAAIDRDRRSGDAGRRTCRRRRRHLRCSALATAPRPGSGSRAGQARRRRSRCRSRRTSAARAAGRPRRPRTECRTVADRNRDGAAGRPSSRPSCGR